jgi:hypothetical protein
MRPVSFFLLPFSFPGSSFSPTRPPACSQAPCPARRSAWFPRRGPKGGASAGLSAASKSAQTPCCTGTRRRATGFGPGSQPRRGPGSRPWTARRAWRPSPCAAAPVPRRRPPLRGRCFRRWPVRRRRPGPRAPRDWGLGRRWLGVRQRYYVDIRFLGGLGRKYMKTDDEEGTYLGGCDDGGGTCDGPACGCCCCCC